MDRGGVFEGLELRRKGDGTRTLRGRFPYGQRAVLSAGGNGRRPRKEQFEAGAFSFAIDDPTREIHALVGHSFDKPLGSKLTQTLTFDDTDDALMFDLNLTPEVQRTSWGQDFLHAFAAGLIIGVSPGFRVPPSDVVPDAEQTIEEDPREGKALIRILKSVVLFELSFVTRAAYGGTEVEERGEKDHPLPSRQKALARWRL